MATLTINLNHTLNTSVQVGDIAYWVETDTISLGSVNAWNIQDGVINLLGPILSINSTNQVIHSIDIDVDPSTLSLPAVNNYLMFSKDNIANMSSILGYYAQLELVNNSNDYAELFSVGCSISEPVKMNCPA